MVFIQYHICSLVRSKIVFWKACTSSVFSFSWFLKDFTSSMSPQQLSIWEFPSISFILFGDTDSQTSTETLLSVKCSLKILNIFRTLIGISILLPSVPTTDINNDFCGLPYESYTKKMKTPSVKHQSLLHLCMIGLTCPSKPFSFLNALLASSLDLNITKVVPLLLLVQAISCIARILNK